MQKIEDQRTTKDEICSGVKLRVTCGRYLAPTGEFLGNGDATTPDGIEPDTIIAEDRGPEALEAGVEAVRRMIASIAEDEK